MVNFYNLNKQNIKELLVAQNAYACVYFVLYIHYSKYF